MFPVPSISFLSFEINEYTFGNSFKKKKKPKTKNPWKLLHTWT